MKTLDDIKDIVAEEEIGSDWETFFDKIYTDGKPGRMEKHFDAIATRFAAEQTAQMKADILLLRDVIKHLEDNSVKSKYAEKRMGEILTKTAHYDI